MSGYHIMERAKSTVAVIIPFYQETASLLIKAIESIKLQTADCFFDIIVVDDSSPVSAEDALSGVSVNERERVRIIKQQNGGAASARNTGLAHVLEESAFIAFLDSDDTWTPAHIENATRVLSDGYDFYFSNHKRDDWANDKFSWLNFDLNKHVCIDKEKALYCFCDDIYLAVLRDHIIQTSSVVCRASAVDKLRFPTGLVIGEDEVFWINVLQRSRQIGFCMQVEVNMGTGINVSQVDNAVSDKAFDLYFYNFVFWNSLWDYVPRSDALELLKKKRLSGLSSNYAASALRRVRSGGLPPLSNMVKFTLKNPNWLLVVVGLVFKKLHVK
ncbi:glycosyltransferase family 2 protein [Plasticicumulans acidivorans]|uniref:Succinoglycan biosynthesis protein ExoW n=1 Tax=Plasticicumulans acidivorans TaxID=886464 RepID=A0A317MXW2_9GAMM|nr:glycosyltransferase family A protein [Plasticicumulans acidivorans]PWV63354.1 succinoglycan biosynthesis protein ExoW [Plasticicumulans acidivorans]